MNFLALDEMVTPKIITLIYWLALAGAVIGGLASLFTGSFVMGIIMIVAGSVLARIYCEIMIVIFKINENLQKLANR